MLTLTYIEYDTAGELTNIAEVYVSEGPDAPPLIPEPIEEPENLVLREEQRETRRRLRALRDARIEELRAANAAEMRATLERRASVASVKMLVLPPGAPLPSLGGRHHLDDRGVLVTRTDAELAAYLEARAGTGAA